MAGLWASSRLRMSVVLGVWGLAGWGVTVDPATFA